MTVDMKKIEAEIKELVNNGHLIPQDFYEINGGLGTETIFKIKIGYMRTIEIIDTQYWEEQEIEVF